MAGSTRIVINSGQNIVDLAIQEAGGIEGIVSLCEVNGVAIDDNLVAGAELKTKGVTIANQSVRQFYRSRHVNTGYEDAEAEGIFDYTFDYTFE
jgi:hypothetical protein